MTNKLSLSVQYAEPAPQLPRWQLRRWVQRALDVATTSKPQIKGALITLRLVGQEEGLLLNQQFRERRYATNVLTFEYGADPSGVITGDIVLCVPVLEREAAEQSKTLKQHAAHLTVHGVLHALGYDHLNDEQAHTMETLEIHILDSLGIPNPYL